MSYWPELCHMTILGAREAENVVVSLGMWRLLSAANSGSLIKEKGENIKGKGDSVPSSTSSYIATYISGSFGYKQQIWTLAYMSKKVKMFG